MQPNYQPSFDNSRDQRIEAVKHMFQPQQQQQQPMQAFYPSTHPFQQSVHPAQSSQLVPYTPQNPFQMVPYAPPQQQQFGYHNPYVPNAPSMALMPYNQSAVTVPAMEAERAVQPYSAYRVRRKEGKTRVNDSDKAFGPLLDEMKQALKKKHAS